MTLLTQHSYSDLGHTIPYNVLVSGSLQSTGAVANFMRTKFVLTMFSLAKKYHYCKIVNKQIGLNMF